MLLPQSNIVPTQIIRRSLGSLKLPAHLEQNHLKAIRHILKKVGVSQPETAFQNCRTFVILT